MGFMINHEFFAHADSGAKNFHSESSDAFYHNRFAMSNVFTIFLPKPIDFSAERCYTDPTSAREVFLLWREKPFRFPLSTLTKESPSKQREVTFYLEVPIT